MENNEKFEVLEIEGCFQCPCFSGTYPACQLLAKPFSQLEGAEELAFPVACPLSQGKTIVIKRR